MKTMSNVKTIVMSPKAVFEAYKEAEPAFLEIYPRYKQWAEEKEEESRKEIEDRILERTRKREEADELREKKEAEFSQKMIEWRAKCWFFRGPKPEKDWIWSSLGLWDPVLCPIYFSGAVEDVKQEFDGMIALSSGCVEEIHLTQEQHQRMLDWVSGKVVKGIEKKMASPVQKIRYLFY